MWFLLLQNKHKTDDIEENARVLVIFVWLKPNIAENFYVSNRHYPENGLCANILLISSIADRIINVSVYLIIIFKNAPNAKRAIVVGM